MKAQILGSEKADYWVALDNGEEDSSIWLPEEELIELSEEEVKLVYQYRELSRKYFDLCSTKKYFDLCSTKRVEQDAKGL